MTIGVGEACAILSALAWAVGIIFYRQLGAALPPLQLNFLKNLLVMAMLLPAIPAVHGLAIPHFTALQLAAAFGSGVLGIALADTLYFRALNELGAGRMGVLGNFYSPLVIVFSFFFLGERLSAWQLLGFVMVSLGVWVAAWPRKEAAGRPAHAMRGFLYALLSICLMAVAIVLVKRVLEAQPLLWVTGFRMLGALLAMLAIAAVRGEIAALRPAPRDFPWPKLVAAAFIGQFVAMVLWMAAYKYTLASVASVLGETASVFILLLAAVWLKEPLTRRAVAGVVLTFGGVCFMLWVR